MKFTTQKPTFNKPFKKRFDSKPRFDRKPIEDQGEQRKPKVDKNPYRGQRFMLTVHGQHKTDFELLKAFFDTDFVKCAAIAKEFGANKIHPHWQVYFEITEQLDFKKRMTEILGHSDFHLEVAKATQASCSNYIYAVDKNYEAGFVEYNKNLPIPRRYKSEAAQFWHNFVPKHFQKEILEIATSLPNRRDIYYFFEEKGNTGKTIIAEYLHIYHGAIITGGNSADMKHAISRWQEITGSDPVIIVVNVARSDSLNQESCKALESIKDGLFFDGKYESAMAHSFTKPHVLIFSNKAPELSFFSEDRWKIFQIVDEKLQKWMPEKC